MDDRGEKKRAVRKEREEAVAAQLPKQPSRKKKRAYSDNTSRSMPENGREESHKGATARALSTAGYSGPFSVREILKGKSILIVGGTGFLGRLMLYMLLKFIPDIGKIFLLIRPTHGHNGLDRFQREVLASPVFSGKAADREYFQKIWPSKIVIVEGDASKKDMGLSSQDKKQIVAEVSVVLHTAGNVDFNPPLDVSIMANAVTTRELLAFTAKSGIGKYVHISTCYVADRTLYSERIEEEHLLPYVLSSSGNQCYIDAQVQIEECFKEIARVRASYESPLRWQELRERATEDLKLMGGAYVDNGKLDNRKIERMARNLRTRVIREELVALGKKEAARIHRPNIYTYTKTLAELLVQSYRDRLDTVIVRPSIVETSIQHPFPGWNEGIQGSAPLMYVVQQGHRMVPDLKERGKGKEAPILDCIPVDEVAAGSILALSALLRGEHKPIYQLSAGQLPHPVTPDTFVQIMTMNRRQSSNEKSGLAAWWHKNMQPYSVKMETFQRFSSPRTLQMLTNLRKRIDHVSQKSLPKRGGALTENLLANVRKNVEKFYQISLAKNRIFQEFMPFMYDGYPIFLNSNARNLWARLDSEERSIFHFNPQEIDYLDWLSGPHLQAVRRWIFPLLEKRFRSINKALSFSEQKRKNAPYPVGRDWLKNVQQLMSDESLPLPRRLGRSLKELRSLPAWESRPLSQWKERGKRVLQKKMALSAGENRLGSQDNPRSQDSRSNPRRQSSQGVTTEARAAWTRVAWFEQHIEKLAGQPIKNLNRLPEELLENISQHCEYITGAHITPNILRELNTPENVQRHLNLWQDEKGKSKASFFQTANFLPKEGVDMPNWLADSTTPFFYELQMWFYRRYLRAKVNGRDKIPYNNNNVIIVANHGSHLDYGLIWYSLGSYGRQMGILAAQDYFFNHFLKATFVRNYLNLIPIERDEGSSYAKSLKNAVQFLREGGPLLIFPEGTRSTDGQMRPFRPGLGYLVDHSGVDVLPIHLFNTNKAMPKGRIIARPSQEVRVEIGNLISNEALLEGTENFSPTKTYNHIARRLFHAVKDIYSA